MIVFLLTIAYLLGSITTSVWIGKLFYKIDVREFGSGNAGATNSFRILGIKAGIPVLIIDILKGFLAVQLYNFYEDGGTELKIALCIMALIGHIFPIFAQFRGGKGVATLLGGVLALTPEIVSFSLIIFILILLSTRYVSLSSLSAGISYPFFLFFAGHGSENPVLMIFSVLVAILLIITHKKNIQRLMRGQENKIPSPLRLIKK